jgi:CubicO group peptidase (beta-lactamase class C family)
MKKTVWIVLLFVIFFVGCRKEEENKIYQPYLKGGDYKGEYYPSLKWRECKPENVGFDSTKLKEVYDYAANPKIKTQALIIIRKGYIFFETYLNNFSRDSLHYSYSVAKSFSSALIGIAYYDKLIDNLDDKIYNYFPKYKELFEGDDSSLKKEITIRNLLTMTSGLQWNEENYSIPENDAFIMIDTADDYFKYILSKSMRYRPGTDWNYSSGDSMLLSGIIEKATGLSPFEYGKKKIFEKIGIRNITWDKDNAGHTITAWGIRTTARNFAKFGYLYLKNGRWENKKIIDRRWIKESLIPVSKRYPEQLPIIDFYGYQWWLLPALENYKNYDILPKTYLAWGRFTQQIFVIPEKDIIIVRLADDKDYQHDDWREAEFLSILLKCLNN